MSLEKLVDAIGKIDPVYVEEAEKWKNETGQRREKRRKRAALRRRLLYRAIPTAACLALILWGAYFAIQNGKGVQNDASGDPGCAMNDNMNQAGNSVEDKKTEDGIKDENPGATGMDGADSDNEWELYVQTIIRNEITDFETAYVDYRGTDAAAAGRLDASDLALEDLESYYGTKVFPTELPEDLWLVYYQSSAKLFREDSVYGMELLPEEPAACEILYDLAGNVKDDNHVLIYRNSDEKNKLGTKELCLSVRTVEAGRTITPIEGQCIPSIIKDTEVYIGYGWGYHMDIHSSTLAEAYLAVFEKDGVTFTIEAKNLTKEEVLAVILELL